MLDGMMVERHFFSRRRRKESTRTEQTILKCRILRYNGVCLLWLSSKEELSF